MCMRVRVRVAREGGVSFGFFVSFESGLVDASMLGSHLPALNATAELRNQKKNKSSLDIEKDLSYSKEDELAS